jgi:regulator of nucleoside diphosphate kinase
MTPLTHHIIVTEYDRQRLVHLVRLLRGRSGVNAWNLDALQLEIERAVVVPPQRVPPNVITMNSRVALLDLDSGDLMAVSLVFPDARGTDGSKVPVLAPLGLALLGCREGDVMEWRTQQGLRRLRVDRVLYQPESTGNFFT